MGAMAAKRDNFVPTLGHHLPAMKLRCNKVVQHGPPWRASGPKMKQARPKMGPPRGENGAR